MQRFHIAPGAVRTAFSRLTNDGWVIREKHGRTSFYRLSETGYRPFAAASARIYAAPSLAQRSDQFVIAIAPNTLATNKAVKTPLASPSVQLFNTDDPEIEKRQSQGWFVLDAEPHAIPDWVHNELLPQDLSDAFDELSQQFENVSVDTPIDALALRTLLIHEWRRFLLRTPIIPRGILSEDSPIRQCRAQVMKTYMDCLELSEEWLDGNGQGPDGHLPAPLKLGERFQR